MTDTKDVDLASGNTSQEKRRKIINGSGGDKLTSALSEKFDDVHVKEVVDTLHAEQV